MVAAFGDLAGMLKAIAVTAPRLAGLLRAVTDPSANAVGVWSVGETAAHVAHSYEGFLAMAQGTHGPMPGLAEIGAANARDLAADPERDLRILARRVEIGARDFVDYLGSARGDPLVVWYGNNEVPRSAMAGALLGEVLVHGFDIARTEGLPWPIEPAHATLAIEGSLPLLPYFVDSEQAADVDACYELHLRGGGDSYWRFRNGSLSIDRTRRRSVDCHLSVEPVAFMLVSYERVPSWGQIVRGKFFTWGRKPWLGFRFPRLLNAP